MSVLIHTNTGYNMLYMSAKVNLVFHVQYNTGTYRYKQYPTESD